MTPTAPPALVLEGLTVAVGDGPPVVRDVSLRVDAGQVLGVVGASGSGKSLTLRAVMGVLPPSARVLGGRLWLVGTEVPLTGREVRSSRRGRLAMVFQDPLAALNPLMRVGAQLAEVLRVVAGVSRADAARRAGELLDLVGVGADRARAYPRELSGGLRQRVMIAIALAVEPAVLLCDEPTTALDVTVQAQVLDLLADLRRRTGTALVLVSHDLAVVGSLADELAVVHAGEIVERGRPDTVLTAPASDEGRALLDAVLELPPPGPLPPAGTASPTPAEVLAARDITVRFGRDGRRGTALTAVDGVGLALGRGRIHGLVGESGSGKTTLGRVLTGQVRPSSGEVVLAGRALGERRTPTERRAVQMVFQDPRASLDPRMTVRQTLAEVIRLDPAQGHRAARADLDDRCMEHLRRVHLTGDHLDRYPGQLSGGERQRVAIARALAVDPAVLVADEPTSSLDSSVQRAVLDLLREVGGELGTAILLISHNLAVVRHLCDEVAVMLAGRIVEHRPTGEVFTDPRHPYTRELLAAVPRLPARHDAGGPDHDRPRVIPPRPSGV